MKTEKKMAEYTKVGFLFSTGLSLTVFSIRSIIYPLKKECEEGIAQKKKPVLTRRTAGERSSTYGKKRTGEPVP